MARIGSRARYQQHHHDGINMADQPPPDVPLELRGTIRLNVAYGVLICPHEQCRKAVQPSAFTRHSHEQHQTPFSARQQLQKFVDKLGWKYDSRTVQRPRDGSEPQPTIPVVDGVECRLCAAESRPRPFKTGSGKSMKKIMKVHGNKDHKRTRVADNELYRMVRVQTWFRGGGEARYWRVEENGDGTRETPIDHGKTDAAEAIHGEDSSAIDATVVTIASGDESVDIPEVEAAAAVVDSDDEVLVPWHPRAVIHDDESVEATEEAAAVVVVDSDDEVLVPSGNGAVPAVEGDSSDESFGDADYVPSEDVTSTDEGDSITGVSDESDDEDGEESRPPAGERRVVSTPRPRKRMFQSAGNTGFDWDGEMYGSSSPPFEGRSPKRQQRMSPFVDSGVVMPPSSESKVRPPDSPNDGFVPRSSPPSVGWGIESQPAGEESFQGAGRAVDGAADDADQDPRSQDPTPARFVFGRRQPTTLDALRERLSAWCQACPACVVMGTEGARVMHDVEDCWRTDAVDIATKTPVMQRHIVERGGFLGRDGCPRCGVPRTICQRWQARPGGSGWEEVGERSCQYETRLTAAVITMLMDGCPEGWAVAEEWMARAGVAAAKQEEVFEWFRGPAWWADMAMEVSRMVRVFHMLAGKNGTVVRR